MCGSGRVGIGVDSRTAGYQIAQRSDFFEVEVGLETTLKRPIINTRDEPHAVADRYRRLHVIIGDANHCDVANLLKMGTTSLVLAMIEADAFRDDLSVRRPVATLHEVSHDPTLQAKVELRRRPPDDRPRAALGVPRPGRRLRGGTVGRRARQRHRRGHALVGHRARQARPRPDGGASRGRLGGQAGGARGLPRARLARLGRPAAEGRRPAVVRRACRAGPGPPAAWPPAGSRCSSTRPTCGAPSTSRPTTPGRGSAGTCLRLFPDEVVAASLGLGDLRRRRASARLQRVPMLEPLKGTEAGVGDLVRNAAGCRVAAARAGRQRRTRAPVDRGRSSARVLRLGSQQVHL